MQKVNDELQNYFLIYATFLSQNFFHYTTKKTIMQRTKKKRCR